MAKPSLRMLILASLLVAFGLFALKFRVRPAFVSEGAADTQPIVSDISTASAVVAPPAEEISTHSSSAGAPEYASAPDPSSARVPALPRKVTMPLVFQSFNRTFWNLNDDQLAVIEQIRSKFLEAVGGLDQDPNDPAYLEKWQKAQPECDALLWFKLGKDFFQEAQLQAYASASFAARGE